jgi:hypothetical protein
MLEKLNYQKYYQDNKLEEILGHPYQKLDLYSPEHVYEEDGKAPFLPDCDDLIRLHYIIRKRKVITALEFGVGWSTIIMAHAIKLNKQDYLGEILGKIRRENPFHLYCVDTEKKYLDITKRNMPKQLHQVVTFCDSQAYLTTFNGRICGRLNKIPNICPDFVYSDGPSFLSIKGNIDGISMTHMDRTIITSDLLQMESLFLPRTLILFDGQTNNARFHKSNFQRNWKMDHYVKEDITTFELDEDPLGPYNYNQLKFQNLI